MSETVKVGPWGAPGGQRRDINTGSRPQRLKTITVGWAFCDGPIAMTSRVTGFSFSYLDQKGDPKPVGPWGTIDEQHKQDITIGPDEQLNLVSGTFDNSYGVTSLVLSTNQQAYGPYGTPAGLAFSVPLQTGAGEVVAFFGSASETLNALGVYALGKNGLPVQIGPWPWGGSGNNYIDTPVQLKSATVYSTQRINGFSFTYVDQNDENIPVGPWGSTDTPGQPPLPLRPGEYVNKITGSFDTNGVTSLEFITNKGGNALYGRRTGTYFSVPLPDNAVTGNPNRNAAVLGFFGRSGGDSLAALGVYVGVAPQP